MYDRHWISRLFGVGRPARRPYRKNPLNVLWLEDRCTPTAALMDIDDFTSPAGKDLLVPVSLVETAPDDVIYTARSDNEDVTARVITGGRSLQFDVTGTDSAGNPFSGTLTLRLFEDLAPLATSRLISLAQNGSYDNSPFHRILDGFVIQGGDFENGDGTGGSTLGDFRDEFDRILTFNSPGLLAMANSGDDSNDTQFFITDIDEPPLDQPQFLNFNHTILGILTGGFDTYTKIVTTKVQAQSAFNPEQSRPVNPVTITDARVITDTQTGVVRVSPSAGFTGSATITVTAEDGSGPSTETFGVNLVTDTTNDRAFLNPVQNQTTTVGTGVSFRLTGTDLDGDTLTFAVRDPNNFNNPPANVSVDVDQTTGLVTLTPAEGFTGTVNMLVGVRDQTTRAGGGQGEFDTQRITLTVTGNIDLATESDTGVLSDDNLTGDPTPTFTASAPAGSTVTFAVNDGPDLIAQESATQPGRFSVTVPEGTMRVGPNTVTASVTTNGSTSDLSPLTVIFAPSLRDSYTVPGDPGASQSVTFDFASKESSFDNEVGLYVADGADGTVDGVSPGDPGYAAAVFASASRQVLFSPSDGVGASRTISFQAGQVIGFYLVRNSTSANLLGVNPTNAAEGEVIAYFSFAAANPDGAEHLQAVENPLDSQALYGWEDLAAPGSDFDYNDLVLAARPEGDPLAIQDFMLVPGAPGRTVSVSFELETATESPTNDDPQSSDSTPGEVGLFLVDNADGAIGSLEPGDPGYTLAALAPDRRRVIFNPGATVPTVTTLNLTGGQLFGVYYIPGGTADQWRTSNPGNNPAVTPLAFFSADAANPDGITHVRNFSPEQVSRSQPAADDPITYHLMGTFDGSLAEFDDVVFSMSVNS